MIREIGSIIESISNYFQIRHSWLVVTFSNFSIIFIKILQIEQLLCENKCSEIHE